jgi:integrase
MACARRLDAIAVKSGQRRGMRDATVFIKYMYARLRVGVARANSTLTYQRSALAFREKCEGRSPWPDDPEVRELVRCHDFAGKRMAAATKQTTRGALTLDLLEAFVDAASEEMATAVAVQYFACLRINELCSLGVDCLTTGGSLRIGSNKAFRRTNATKVATTQTKPLDALALSAVRNAQEAARGAGRDGEDPLITIRPTKYRTQFRAAIMRAGISIEGLDFVPHSVRHGRVADMKASAPYGKLTKAQLDLAGMSAATAVRYGRSNEERIERLKEVGPEPESDSDDD